MPEGHRNEGGPRALNLTGSPDPDLLLPALGIHHAGGGQHGAAARHAAIFSPSSGTKRAAAVASTDTSSSGMSTRSRPAALISAPLALHGPPPLHHGEQPPPSCGLDAGTSRTGPRVSPSSVPSPPKGPGPASISLRGTPPAFQHWGLSPTSQTGHSRSLPRLRPTSHTTVTPSSTPGSPKPQRLPRSYLPSTTCSTGTHAELLVPLRVQHHHYRWEIKESGLIPGLPPRRPRPTINLCPGYPPSLQQMD